MYGTVQIPSMAIFARIVQDLSAEWRFLLYHYIYIYIVL